MKEFVIHYENPKYGISGYETIYASDIREARQKFMDISKGLTIYIIRIEGEHMVANTYCE